MRLYKEGSGSQTIKAQPDKESPRSLTRARPQCPRGCCKSSLFRFPARNETARKEKERKGKDIKIAKLLSIPSYYDNHSVHPVSPLYSPSFSDFNSPQLRSRFRNGLVDRSLVITVTSLVTRQLQFPCLFRSPCSRVSAPCKICQSSSNSTAS